MRRPGTQEEKDEADRLSLNFQFSIFDLKSAIGNRNSSIPTEGPLGEKMKNLRDVGYQSSYSVEHHSGKNEYAKVAIQLARVRAMFDRLRTKDFKNQ